jgi:hypothetical protein
MLTLTACRVVENYCLFLDGNARMQGGGIHNSGLLTLVSTLVADNRGGRAGGIYNDGGTVSLVESEVRNNISFGVFSGIVSLGSLTLVDSTVDGNSTGTDSPAIYSDGYLSIIGSTVSRNRTDGGDGGIQSRGDAAIVNSTISRNGSVCCFRSELSHDDGTLTLESSTIVGSGITMVEFGASSQAFISNSVIRHTNDVFPYAACDLTQGSVTSLGGNIESPGDTCGFDQPTDLVNVSLEDLAIGPLQDNGGPTMTHALLPGSVAIDRIPGAMCVDADGQPLTTDQRGEPRPETGGTMCDVGSFEVQP